MDFTTISGASGSASVSGAAATKTLGKDEFLRLFVTQLRAQNPLNPMDGSGFTAQMAQFSSLEQLTNMNSKMDALVLYQTSLQNTLTADLIGKQVAIDGGKTGTVASVQFGSQGASLLLDDGTTVLLSQIREIGGK